MLYAKVGGVVPKEWEHDPTIRNKNKNTVAFLYTGMNKVIGSQWLHDPNI